MILHAMTRPADERMCDEFIAERKAARRRSPEERFDADAFHLRSALNDYLSCHDALDDVQIAAREDAVAATIDFLTNAEIAEALAWSKVRSDVRVAA